MARPCIWKQVVKEVEQTVAYPGYRYVYFKDDADADVYFRELYGPDWKDLPWARFMINREDEVIQAKENRRSRYQFEDAGLANIDGASVVPDNATVAREGSYDYLIMQLVKSGVRDPHAVYAELNNKVVQYTGKDPVYIKPDMDRIRAKTAKYIRELGRRKSKFTSSAVKDAVRELMKHHKNHYKIHDELVLMGINISRRRVSNIIQEIKNDGSGS